MFHSRRHGTPDSNESDDVPGAQISHVISDPLLNFGPAIKLRGFVPDCARDSNKLLTENVL